MKSLIDIMGVATMKDNIFLMTQISVANFLYVVKKRMKKSNNQRSLAIIVSREEIARIESELISHHFHTGT